jgi:hypothetical protein
MAGKNALRLHQAKTFASAGLVTLETEPTPDNMTYCLQRAAWEISKATSGGNTRARLYISGHGYKHYLAEQDAPAADALYKDVDPVWLVPGESLALDIDEAQAGTVAKLDATGYWTLFSEGIV